MNIVKRILAANRDRDPDRLAMKYRDLRSSPFAFLRGTCRLYYDRLAESGFDVPAPAVWCCGDLHLENFGSYKGDNRLVYFDINDFDEAALAPTSWELVRLVTSAYLGLQAQGIAPRRLGELVESLIGQYARALACGKAGWIERDTAQGLVRQLLDQLRERKRVDYLNSRTRLVRKRRRLLLDGRRALAVADAERQQVVDTMHRFAASQAAPEFFRVLDVALRIAGTGSLGLARYVVLVEGRGSPDRNYLFDLKQAVPSALGGHFKALQPHWDDDAQRIASLQARMQAVTAAFLHPLRHAGRPFVLRALQPSEDRLPFGRSGGFGPGDELLEGAIGMLAQSAAWAQLRSSGRQGSASADELIAFAGKKKWRRQVMRAAAAMADQVTTDWTRYGAAFDAGQFAVGQVE